MPKMKKITARELYSLEFALKIIYIISIGNLAEMCFYCKVIFSELCYFYLEVRLEMEWLTQMNDALNYIELNLQGTVDFSEVAHIACSSLTRFQRMFTFMTDMTIGDYVKCRKMSLAAEDLKNTDIKVIEIALKYGYKSPEAFTRAFQSFHGAPPTVVRKSGISKVFHPISFQIKINGGNMMMGSKPVVQIEELSNLKVVCFQVNCKEPENEAWNQMRKWVVSNLNDYEARRYIGYAPCGHHPESSEEEQHEYVAMMLLYGEEGQNDYISGVKVCDAPKGLYLVGDVMLNEFDDNGNIDIGESMKKSSQIIYECMLDMKGYTMDLSERTYLEEVVFPKEWFLAENTKELQAEYKFWLPIKKQ